MGGLFGGSKSKSYNKAYDQIKGWASPLLGYAGEGAGGLSDLLSGDASGFNTFKSNVGYDWNLNQGTNDILAQRAAVGGLDSGASLKALANYQTGLNNQYLGNYMGGMTDLAGIGTNAASILTSAGQVQKSKSSPGIAGGLGGLLSGIAAF
jgi:hypothetical protein